MDLRYAAMVGGFTGLAVTKLDVLSGLGELRACTAYRYDGRARTRFPSEVYTLEQRRWSRSSRSTSRCRAGRAT